MDKSFPSLSELDCTHLFSTGLPPAQVLRPLPGSCGVLTCSQSHVLDRDLRCSSWDLQEPLAPILWGGGGSQLRGLLTSVLPAHGFSFVMVLTLA